MKRNLLRSLLTAVVCLAAGVSAQAQFSGTITQYPTTDYSTKAANFNLEEVATQLGTTAATLAETFAAWQEDESGSMADMFFLTLPDGTLSNDYTQGSKGGFWVTVDGMPQVWGVDNSLYRWYNTVGMDADEGTMAIYMGQYPEQCQIGDKFTPKFVLKFGEKEATFDVTFEIIEKPVVNIPEPTLLWKNLNIVGELTIDVNQKQRSNYNSDAVSADLSEVIANLGIADLNVVSEELREVLYVPENILGDDVALGTYKSDTLTNRTSANGIGFWMQGYDNQEGSKSIECGRAGYGSDCHFYMESFAFNAESNILSCTLGQMPSKLEGDMQYFTYVYLIWGDKAIQIRYNLNIEKVDVGEGINAYTIVGEDNVLVEQEITSNHEATQIHPDMEAIAAALGCEVSDIDMAALRDDIDFGSSTANNGGFWFGEDGFVISYGSNCTIYVEPVVSGDYTTLRVGQYPNHFTEAGQEQSVTVYFLGNDYKAFAYNVTLRIIDPVIITNEFQSVAQRSYIVQQKPDNNYAWSDGVDIPYDFISESIGDSYVVYGMAQLTADGKEQVGNDKYTKNYCITETPGFWLDRNGRRNTWQGDPGEAVFGITAGGRQSGKFNLIQYPNRCNVGDVLTTKLFFVNETTSKMVTFNFTYSIVEEVKTYETVGEADITLPVSVEDFTMPIDLSATAEALGVTVDYLLSEETLCPMTEAGVFGQPVNSEDGLGFNQQGFFDMQEGIAFLYFVNDGGEVTINTYSQEEVADDFALYAQFCFRVDEKQYIYNVKFVAPSAFDSGVNDLTAVSRNAGKVFDLSGRRVMQPKQGVYILNGRKVVK
ncbi:MAG: DUF4859 domain-containing protein [Prevotella sp.]|nr:DUF4859 domain-containing protein [Prevotella sp.]